MSRTRVAIVGYTSFLAFVAALVVAESTTYRTNVYAVLPGWGWVAFALALGVGGWLVYDAVRFGERRQLAYALVLVFLVLADFWFYAQFVGLPFWSPPRGDLLQHYGRAKAIVSTGDVDENNIYPPLHVLVAKLRLVTGVPYSSLGPLVSLTYYSLLVSGIALLVRRVTDARTAGYVLFASLPIYLDKYAHHLMPWVAYYSLIPLLLLLGYLHGESPSRRIRRSAVLCVLLLATGMMAGHPMSFLVAVAVVTTVAVSAAVTDAWTDRTTGYRRLPVDPFLLAPVVVAYPLWYLSKVSFQRFLLVAVGSLVSPGLEGGAEFAVRAGTSGYTPVQLVRRYLIGRWGPLLLLLGLSAPIAVVLAYRFVRRATTSEEGVLLGVYLLGGLMGFAMLFANFIARGPTRINQVTVLAGVVMVGVAVWRVTEGPDSPIRRVVRPVLVLVVVVGLVTTPFAVYNENAHVTETEFEGAEHHLRYADWDRTTYSDTMAIVLSQYLLGFHRAPEHHSRVFGRDDHQLPKYLGYNDSRRFDESVPADSFYVVTKTRDVRWWHHEPANRRPHIRYYTASNLSEASGDPSIHRIYSNGNFSTWSSAD